MSQVPSSSDPDRLRKACMSIERKEWISAYEEALDGGRRLVQQLWDETDAQRRRIAELEDQLQLTEERLSQVDGPEAGDRRSIEPGRSSGMSVLRSRLEQIESQHRELLTEHSDLERQNSNYLSLYVASSQIHATLVFEEVLRNIKEIVINLIGSDVFAIYLADDSMREFRRAASEGGVDPADEVIPFGDNLLSTIAKSGSLRLHIERSDLPSGQRPIAILPLMVGNQAVGLVVFFQLLVQKEDFDNFDMELFSLLAAHAATALMSSSRFRRLERKAQTLQALLDLFKTGNIPERAGEEP